MTDQTTSPYSGRPVTEWLEEQYTLLDAAGDKIGEIVEINPDFVIAETDGGFLGLGERRQYFVPRTAISGDTGTQWHLSVFKDELDTRAGPRRPRPQPTLAVTGARSTMPAARMS